MNKTLATMGAGALIASGTGALAGAVLTIGAVVIQEAENALTDPFLPWAIIGGLAVSAAAGLLAFAGGCSAHSLVRRSGHERLAITTGAVLAALIAGGTVLSAAIETRHTMPAALTAVTVPISAAAALIFGHVINKRASCP